MKTIIRFGFAASIAGVLLLLTGCTPEDSDELRKAKLELQKKIDETIVKLDEAMVSLQDNLSEAKAHEDSTRVKGIEQQLQTLKDLRSNLEQTTDELQTVPEKQWRAFETEAEKKLEEANTTLAELQAQIKGIPGERPYF